MTQPEPDDIALDDFDRQIAMLVLRFRLMPMAELLQGGEHRMTHHRAAASGEHAEHLHEAARRLESSASLLSMLALGMVPPVVAEEVLPLCIAVLDEAQQYVKAAGQQE